MKRILLLEQEVIKDLRAENYKKKDKKGHYPKGKYSAMRAYLFMKPMSKALVYQVV